MEQFILQEKIISTCKRESVFHMVVLIFIQEMRQIRQNVTDRKTFLLPRKFTKSNT